jgi:hypothetical protein
MRPYRIVTQVSLLLSIFNLVLAAPIVVREIHEARTNPSETVAVDDAEGALDGAPPQPPQLSPASPQHSSDGSMSPPPSPVSPTASPQHSSDELTPPPSTPASPQHSSEGSMDSGYPTPYLSESSSVSGYSWMLQRPPRQDLNLPPSLQGLDSINFPHPAPQVPQVTGPVRAMTALEVLAPPPPTGMIPDDARFFNRNVMKKLRIAGEVAAVGGIFLGTLMYLGSKSHSKTN